METIAIRSIAIKWRTPAGRILGRRSFARSESQGLRHHRGDVSRRLAQRLALPTADGCSRRSSCDIAFLWRQRFDVGRHYVIVAVVLEPGDLVGHLIQLLSDPSGVEIEKEIVM